MFPALQGEYITTREAPELNNFDILIDFILMTGDGVDITPILQESTISARWSSWSRAKAEFKVGSDY